MAFDRDEFVRLLTDFYEFCVRVYLEPQDLALPPAGGWPEITTETVAGLQKNDTVIDLLRHMPYLNARNDYQNMPQIMVETYPVNYRHEYVLGSIRRGEIEHNVEPYGVGLLPPHCVCIFQGTRNGYYLILDTSLGYIYWSDPNGEHDEQCPEQPALDLEEAGEEDPEERWREQTVYYLADFFALCKQRFNENSWIGIRGDNVMSCRCDEWDEEHRGMAEGMRKYGWPGDGEGRDWDRAGFEKEFFEEGGYLAIQQRIFEQREQER